MRLIRGLFSALVYRELLVFSRRPWTHWGRVTTGLGAFGVLLVLSFLSGSGQIGLSDGRGALIWMLWGLFVAASVGGVRTTFDCVSRERREGTLGLLFLTDLRATTILLAKLISSSFQNLYAIVAVLPVLGTCMLAGGVSWQFFMQGALAVLAALWISIQVGLFQTCRTEDDHEAFSGSIRWMILIYLLPFVSPFWALVAAWTGQEGFYWSCLAGSSLLGGVLWIATCRTLAGNWRGLKGKKAVEAMLGISPRVRMKRRGNRCGDQDPAVWIITRYGDPRQVSPRQVGTAIACMVVPAGWIVRVTGDVDVFGLVYPGLMGVCKVLVWVTMCKLAPQGFAQVVKGGGVEILLTTPMTVEQLIRGAVKHLWGQFGWTVGLLLGVDLVAVLVAAEMSEAAFSNFLGQVVLHNVVFVLGLHAMASFGVWMGLLHERYSQAVLRVTGAMLMVPAVFFILLPGDWGLAVGLVMVWFLVWTVAGAWRVMAFVKGSGEEVRLGRVSS